MASSSNPKQETTQDVEADPQRSIKIIVTSLHTCSMSARKQRFEVWPHDNLSILGHTIANPTPFEDFVPPDGAFYFQYYDSEEDEMVGIPRLDEARHLAKDFRNKRLTVVPAEKPPAQTKEPKKQSRKKKRKKANKKKKKEQEEQDDESEDSDSVDSSVAIVATLPDKPKKKTKTNKRKKQRRQETGGSKLSDSEESSVVFMGVSNRRAKEQRRGENKHPPTYNFQKPGRS
jgi:flagellar biosynthesis GTPase FlhF